MDLQFKSIPFEVKASAPDGSTFEGKASPFWNIDSYGEIVDDKAFDQDLPDFLADGFIGGLNHDWDNPIGTPMDGTMPMEDHLHIKGSVIDTSHGMDVRKMLKAGIVKKLSIGYRTLGDMMLETEDDCMAYWETKKYKPSPQDMARCKMGMIRVLTRIKLFEVSPVTVPANDMAVITAVKAAREAAEKAYRETPTEKIDPPAEDDSSIINESRMTPREYEAFLRDAGISRSKVRQAISLAKTLQWDAGSDEAEPVTDGPDEEVPESDETETPNSETENAPDGSETLTTEKSEGSDEVIVTQPADNLVEIREPDREEFDPLAEEVRKARERYHRKLTQSIAELDEKISRSIGMFGS